MKSILTLLLLCFSLTAFGQSKKKLNKQLNAQYKKELATYDSLRLIFAAVHEDYRNERAIIKKSRDDLSGLVGITRELRLSVGWSLDLLDSLNEDKPYRSQYDSLMKFPVIDKMERYFDEINQFKNSYNYEHADDWKVTYSRIAELDIVQQNEELPKIIQGVNSSNELLRKLLINQRALLSKSDGIKHELDSLALFSNDMNSTLYSFSTVLKERTDQLKQNYKLNGPKGFPEIYAKAFPLEHVPKKPKTEEGYKYGKDIEVVPSEKPNIRDVQLNENEVVEVVDVAAEFIGGDPACLYFLQSNLKYPEYALDAGIGGKVYLRFVVSKTGSISNVVVQRGIPDCKECDDEAVRVISSMPNWKPGLVNGKEVNSYYSLPIKFTPN